MNKTTIELAFNLVGRKGYAGQSANKQAESGEAFFPVLQRSISPSPRASSHGRIRFSHTKSPARNKASLYLESLRKALLAQGTPMNQVYVKDDGVLLLAKLLLHCGFSQEKVTALLEESAEGSSQGRINLSTFFHNVTESSPLDKKLYEDTVIEPSAIPYLESALRDLGLALEEIGALFDAAKVEGGGLSLNRFVTKLGIIGNAGAGAEHPRHTWNERPMRRSTSSQYVPAGDQPAERGGRISIRDLIAALKDAAGQTDQQSHVPPAVQAAIEHMEERLSQGTVPLSSKHFENQHRMMSFTERGDQSVRELLAGLDKEGRLPHAVKAAIEQIVNKAAIYEENGKPASSSPSFSRPEAANEFSNSKTGENGSRYSGERLIAVSKDDSGIEGTAIDRNPEPGLHGKRLRIVSDSTARVTDTGINEDHTIVKPQAKMVPTAQDAKGAPFSDTAETAAQHQESSKSVLPPYVIGQVGKQISRSLLRAEKVIRLQLKPPELGTLKIEMDMKDNLLKLGMIAENHSVRELLLSNIHELREALLDQGVKLDRLDVHTHSNMNNAAADSHEGGAGRHQGMGERDEAAAKEDNEHEALLPGSWNMDDGEHAVDLVA